MELYLQAAHAAILQGSSPLRFGAVLLLFLFFIGGCILGIVALVWLFSISDDPGLKGSGFRLLGCACAAALCFLLAYSLSQRVPEVSVQTDSKQDAPKQDAPKQDAPKQDAPKQDAPKQDTSEVRGTEDKAQQPKESDQASKPTRKPKEPITVESTTCLVKEAKTSEPRTSTAKSSELLVTVTVPSNARECHDTVTIDAPTFGLGKEPNQSVSVARPQESYEARWLLDPEKPGRWNIAVETKRDRELVPVLVTTPLGFPAAWVQAGAILAGAATCIFGALAFIYRHH